MWNKSFIPLRSKRCGIPFLAHIPTRPTFIFPHPNQPEELIQVIIQKCTLNVGWDLTSSSCRKAQNTSEHDQFCLVANKSFTPLKSKRCGIPFFSSYPDPPHLCFPPPQPTLGIDSSHNLIVYSECGMEFDVIVCLKELNLVWVWAVETSKTAHARTRSDSSKHTMTSNPDPTFRVNY